MYILEFVYDIAITSYALFLYENGNIKVIFYQNYIHVFY